MAEVAAMRRRLTRRGASAWPVHGAALALGGCVLLLLFGQDAREIVEIWWRTGAFHHGLLIPPVIAWLVWERAGRLAAIPPGFAWQGVVLLSVGALLWLTGAAAFVALARQAGLVVMAMGLAVALIGWPAAMVLRAPLGLALFLIPAGTELEPWLQDVTARIAVALLHAVGTPATMDGVFIETRAGLFKVAEACSGTAFVLAMAAFALLVCLRCFASPLRRAIFVAVALPVAVLANGLRAWAVMETAQHRGMDDPLVADHILYGWFLFAGVLALLMLAASRWFEPVESPPVPAVRGRSAPALVVGALCLALMLAPRLWIAATEVPERPPSPPPGPARVVGWNRLPGMYGEWGPHFDGATWIGQWRYRDATGNLVDLALVVFDRQAQGREMVGFAQGATGPEEASFWLRVAGAPAPEGMRAQWLRSRRGERRYVALAWLIGETVTGNAMAAKLAGARERLLRGNTSGRALLLSVQPAPGAAPGDVAARFLAAGGGARAIADRMHPASGGD